MCVCVCEREREREIALVPFEAMHDNHRAYVAAFCVDERGLQLCSLKFNLHNTLRLAGKVFLMFQLTHLHLYNLSGS